MCENYVKQLGCAAATWSANQSCAQTACPPSVCGNGILDAGEECDNGGANSNYADCKLDCTNATCGDGWLNKLGPDLIEECDSADPTCFECEVVRACSIADENGNPVPCLLSGLQCDYLFSSGSGTCRSNNAITCNDNPTDCPFVPIRCQSSRCEYDTNLTGGCNFGVCSTQVCGDGYTTGDEECDDGNNEAGDGCDNCQLECGLTCLSLGTPCTAPHHCPAPVVGCFESDNTTYCDYGADAEEACPLYTSLVDGHCVVVEDCPPEENCITQWWPCIVEVCTPVCGNGIVEEGEQCDDFNIHARDGCDMMCQFECDVPVAMLMKTANLTNFSYAGEVILYSYHLTTDIPVNNVTVLDDRCSPVVCPGPEPTTDMTCTCTYIVQESDLGADVMNTANVTVYNALEQCANHSTTVDSHTVDYEPVCGNGFIDMFSCVNSTCVGGPWSGQACSISGDCYEQCDDGNVIDHDACCDCMCTPPAIMITTAVEPRCAPGDRYLKYATAVPTNAWTEILNFVCSGPQQFLGCTEAFPTANEVTCTCRDSGPGAANFGRFVYRSTEPGCDAQVQAFASRAPETLLCPDNGIYCDGEESCFFNFTEGSAQCVSSGDPCTNETVCGYNLCNATLDECVFFPNTTDCPEDTYCFPALNETEEGNLGRCSPDCQPNGVPDEDDIAFGGIPDLNNNSVPDNCDSCAYSQGFWKNAENSNALPGFDFGDAEWQERCENRTVQLVQQCNDIPSGPSPAECAALGDFLTGVDGFCSSLPEYYDLSYPSRQNTNCARLQRQLFAFLVNTFLGALGDIPPYVEIGTYVPDALLEEVVDYLTQYPLIFDVRTCFDQNTNGATRTVLIAFAGILEDYNLGEYPDSVKHCGEDAEANVVLTCEAELVECQDTLDQKESLEWALLAVAIVALVLLIVGLIYLACYLRRRAPASAPVQFRKKTTLQDHVE